MKKTPASYRENTLLGVGEVAARSGVSVSALRFYEESQLIDSFRSVGGQRRYARDVLRRVAVIKVAQRIGIPLAEIRDALATLPTSRAPTAADWQRMSKFWHGQLQARIDTLLKLRDQLNECIGCGCLSLDSCPLRNPGDSAAQGGPGARLFDPERA